MAWRVGDGKRIDCFKDRWVGLSHVKLPDPMEDRDQEISIVEDLIDEHGPYWKEEVIRRSFSMEDADKILRMPLSSQKPCDKSFWAPTKSGKFSVKSAFHLAIGKFSKCAIHLPSASSSDPIWKNIWLTKTPPKVGHFLWSACSDSLPTKQNLFRRGIRMDPTCTRCGVENETLSHILVECTFAKEVWCLGRIRFDLHTFGKLPFRSLCGKILKTPKHEGATIFAFLAWNIWKARNMLIFEEISINPHDVIERTLRQTAEMHGDWGQASTPQKSRRQPVWPWQPPPVNHLKLNSDAAIFSDGIRGLGFVVRNDVGEVILAGARICWSDGDSTLAEALAMHWRCVLV